MIKITARSNGYLAAALMLTAVFMMGIYLQRLPADWKQEKSGEESFPPLIPSNNPAFIQDQIKTRDIALVARRMDDDWDMLTRVYDTLPAYKPPGDGRLQLSDIDKYTRVYEDFSRDFKSFKKNTIGPHPGPLRTFAIYGMLKNYVDLLRMRALVRNRVTEEEFEWIKARVMEAALFSVDNKMAHDPISAEQKQHLDRMRNQLLLLSGVTEMDNEGNLIDHTQERYKPLISSIPQTNIRLFLDNYPRIKFPDVNFDQPTIIALDRDQILKDAANNPP